MLYKLQPKKVEAGWDTIAPLILKSLPPISANVFDVGFRILKSVMLDKSQVWAYMTKDKPVAIVLTSVQEDPVLGLKSLLIYALHTLDNIPIADWQNGIEAIQRFAGSRECANVVAFVTDDRLVDVSERLGALSSSVICFPSIINREELQWADHLAQ